MQSWILDSHTFRPFPLSWGVSVVGDPKLADAAAVPFPFVPLSHIPEIHHH